MKTLNHSFSSQAALAEFIGQHSIVDNKQLLIQVFTAFSDIVSIKSLQQVLQSFFAEASLIGASSDGNIIDSQVPDLGQTTLSFTQFDETQLNVALVPAKKCAIETGRLLGNELYHPDSKVIISFTDGIHTNGEDFLNGLSSRVPDTLLAGGMAGDNGLLVKTSIFTLTDISHHGAVGVSLSNPNLIANTHYSFDWQSIGRQMKVTRAEGNTVYEIDYQPAKMVYEKYLGKEVSSKLPMTGIEFPLVKLHKGTNIGRAITASSDKGALNFAGNLHEGDLVQFGIGSKERIIDSSFQIVNRLNEQPIESIFIYSCMARRRFLGEHANAEMAPFSACEGVAGFYTYGEFYYSQNSKSPSLLNQTMTMLFLSESVDSKLDIKASQAQVLKPFDQKQSKLNNQIDTLAAVSNLAYNVSHDFEVLNAMLEHEVEKKTQELISRSLIDDLTKLPNRQSLLQDLKTTNNETLIVININDFSKLNGFYGLEAGDEVLLKIGLSLQKHIYSNNHYLIRPKLYKLPSDEYAILAVVEDEQALVLGLQTLNREVFLRTYQILGFDIQVQATWVYSECDGSERGLVQAELACKEARLNKSNFVRYDLEKFNETNKKLKIAQQVRRAILENRLYPVFQPIFCNKSGGLVKYECLARLKDDNGDVISPLIFIEIAQMIQMYPMVTEIMIHKSFKAFQDTGLSFAVNISLEDIQSSTTQEMIFAAIAYYGVADQVTFEILENQALEEDAEIFEFIRKIKNLGAKIAIDDFGSGYANYEHLAKLHADTIKIDGSLIRKLGHDTVAISVVESMLVFAKKLNMKVVAEFVCNEDVYKQVCKEGIDYSQGFYLSEPLDVLPISTNTQVMHQSDSSDFPFNFL